LAAKALYENFPGSVGGDDGVSVLPAFEEVCQITDYKRKETFKLLGEVMEVVFGEERAHLNEIVDREKAQIIRDHVNTVIRRYGH